MRTRVELIGKLVKPPVLGATPSGRAVLRLSVDCGEAPECLLLDVVLIDEGGRDLARILNAGDHVRVVGALRALRRTTAAVSARQQFEVVALEVIPEQPGNATGDKAGLRDRFSKAND